ncbi:MAG TPA: preprotein translocase subunit SecG [Gemmatimonadales bacterium]|nr:preprotein translocase subunit SecG [Gemmatimonadales bacterium]
MEAVLKVVLILDALILITAILLQAGQGGGLASLGGGSGTELVMGGRQAVTLLHKITWWCGGIFLALALILAVISSRGGEPRSVLEGTTPPPAPVQTAPLPLQPAPGPTPQNPTPSPTPNR